MVIIEDLVTGDTFKFKTQYAAKNFVSCQEIIHQRKLTEFEFKLDEIEQERVRKLHLEAKKFEDEKEDFSELTEKCDEVYYLRNGQTNKLIYYYSLFEKMPRNLDAIRDTGVCQKYLSQQRYKIKRKFYPEINSPKIAFEKLSKLTGHQYNALLYFHNHSEAHFKKEYCKILKRDLRSFRGTISALKKLKLIQEKSVGLKCRFIVIEDLQ